MKFPVPFAVRGFGFYFLTFFLAFVSSLYSLPASADSAKGTVVLRLKEGESALIPGTRFTIAIKSVIDMTSSGCMGGPIGCRDRVTIVKSEGRNNEDVVLEMAKTPAQKKQKIDQTSIEGKTVRLTRINQKEVEFIVEESLAGQKNNRN